MFGMRSPRAAAVLVAGAMVLVPAGAFAAPPALPVGRAAGRTVLTASVLPDLGALPRTGTVPASRRIQFTLTLQRPDPAGEEALFRTIYDPSSPTFHQALSPEQFAARFGVRSTEIDAVRAWLAGAHLAPTFVSRDGVVWLVAGRADDIESAFATHLRTYRADGRSVVANDTAPSVPAGLPIRGVDLSDRYQFHTQAFPVSASTTPQDLWSLYDQPADNTGEGQQMALFGWGVSDGVEDDLRAFEQAHHLPATPFRVARVGAAPDPTDTDGKLEWDMDSQASTGMAPGAVMETFYFGTGAAVGDAIAAFHAWADDPNGALQGSASFGLCEDNPALTRLGIGYGDELNAVLRQATIEGRTLFASSGDTGSGCPPFGVGVNGVTISPFPEQEVPAASPYATAVGGTVITTNDDDPPTRDVEYAWTHGGGGPSLWQRSPSYQDGVTTMVYPCVTDTHTSTAATGQRCRGVPDVAAQSGDLMSGYSIIVDGQPTYGAGTSLSSPLWLGMWTRVQAAAPVPNGSRIPGNGFANPVLYDLGRNATTYARDFVDVTIGDNGLHHAGPGWDYTTGWGVPDVAHLVLDVNHTTTTAAVNLAATAPPLAQPVPTGTTCWNDIAGDDAVPTDAVTGTETQEDLLRGSLSNGRRSMRTTLTLDDLRRTLPPGVATADYYMFWTLRDATYFSDAQMSKDGTVSFTDGVATTDTGTTSFTTLHHVTGKLKLGRRGTIAVDVPLADVGNPAAGDRLTQVSGAVLITYDPAEAFGQQVDAGGPVQDYVLGAGCVPPPPPPPPTGPTGCTVPPVIADAADDAGPADGAVVAGPAYADVDLRDVHFAWDGVAPALTLTVHVTDLRSDLDPPPSGTVGEAFDTGFTIGQTAYYVRASRRFGRPATFALRQRSDGTAGSGDTTIATITGAFDGAADTVSATIPAGPPLSLATGTVLTGLTATAWQDDGVLLRDDDASSGCSLTLG